jgi:N-methylhydantoinase A/oxoprolinase/acetone carboxylase beta subunit
MTAVQAHPYRICVDVGGTNTDAVILDSSKSSSPTRGIIATHKTPTTSPNATDGIETAVRSILS